MTAYTDASLSTASKGRSVVGHLVKLHPLSGSIFAKATATQSVHLSSFEAELDGLSSALKSVSRVSNILTELQQSFGNVADVFSDNKAMIDFVHGDGVAKGVRHMELRMWYIREQYAKGNVKVAWMPGVVIPADKLGNKTAHAQFRRDILGLGLLSDSYPVVVDVDDAGDDEYSADDRGYD